MKQNSAASRRDFGYMWHCGKLCKTRDSVAFRLGRLLSLSGRLRDFSPLVPTYKGNPTFEFSGKVGGVGCYVHRLSRFAA